MTTENTTNKVTRHGNVSGSFKVNNGLRQGDPLSTALFNIILEHIIRKSELNRTGTLVNRSHQCLAYADDVVLLARNKTELVRITAKVIEEAKKIGLKVNERKSNYMIVEAETPKTTERQQQLVVPLQNNENENLTFRRVDSYTYLGVLITDKCNEGKEMEARLLKSNKCAGALNKIIVAKEVSRGTKMRIYKTVVRPTLLYASETWVLNKKEQIKIETWERKILRRILGGKKTEGGWERRTNNEVYELYKEPKITEVVKSRRIQWLGHLERMEGSRTTKNIAWKVPEGKKKKGRPRKRWSEEVMKNLQEKRIQNWKEKARNRKEWKKIIKLWA